MKINSKISIFLLKFFHHFPVIIILLCMYYSSYEYAKYEMLEIFLTGVSIAINTYIFIFYNGINGVVSCYNGIKFACVTEVIIGVVTVCFGVMLYNHYGISTYINIGLFEIVVSLCALFFFKKYRDSANKKINWWKNRIKELFEYNPSEKIERDKMTPLNDRKCMQLILKKTLLSEDLYDIISQEKYFDMVFLCGYDAGYLSELFKDNGNAACFAAKMRLATLKDFENLIFSSIESKNDNEKNVAYAIHDYVRREYFPSELWLSH